MAFSKSGLEKTNQDEFDKIASWLRQGTRAVLQSAVSKAHSAIMQPQGMGGAMQHDSSNAAFNWQISVNGERLAPIEGFDQPPVGEKWSARADNGMHSAIIATLMARFVKDAKKLDSALWRGNIIPQISLVNPIDELESSDPMTYAGYVEHSRIKEAISSNVWEVAAKQAAQSTFDAWMAGGPKVDWSQNKAMKF